MNKVTDALGFEIGDEGVTLRNWRYVLNIRKNIKSD